MKKKLVQKTKPQKPKKDGWQITLQELEEILVFNVWNDGKLYARHAVSTKTHEFATWLESDQKWFATKIQHAIGMTKEMYGEQYWWGSRYEAIVNERWNLSDKDEKRIKELFPLSYRSASSLTRVSEAEGERSREKRQTAEQRRRERVAAMMARMPEIPDDLEDWSDRKICGGIHWILKGRDGSWHCSQCGGTVLNWPAVDKIKDGSFTECPNCGEPVKIQKRRKTVSLNGRSCLIQPIDEEISVARYFRTWVEFNPMIGEKKEIETREEIRIVLFKKPLPKMRCDIYYEQWAGFDNKGNPYNRRWDRCWLYDGGIREALHDTYFEPWEKLFGEFARAGMKLDYNAMMIGSENPPFVGLCEMLFRGRFYALLESESEAVSYWSWEYAGHLKPEGKTIEEVFGVSDRQKINRIRDKNGGRFMLNWMRWSDASGKKIGDEELAWLDRQHIWPTTLTGGTRIGQLGMSVTQVVNYLKRQMKESYPGWSGNQVLNQWRDYLAMAKDLKKNLADEMVFKPRELKRRHDELVEEKERLSAKLQAREYSRKYGAAEKVLKEIREKFEYAGEEYLIVVPKKIVDIVEEGNKLHHCAGATDRYFDRIKNRETFICFLRRKREPKVPFYTIEVEPGGTIRQHRGAFDEEPELEKVKPFLREWQREIRKRMKAEDHELAAVSARKREENNEELRRKNNTRVLEKLMEDLMEAM